MCCFRLHFSDFNVLFLQKNKKTCCSLLLEKITCCAKREKKITNKHLLHVCICIVMLVTWHADPQTFFKKVYPL